MTCVLQNSELCVYVFICLYICVYTHCIVSICILILEIELGTFSLSRQNLWYEFVHQNFDFLENGYFGFSATISAWKPEGHVLGIMEGHTFITVHLECHTRAGVFHTPGSMSTFQVWCWSCISESKTWQSTLLCSVLQRITELCFFIFRVHAIACPLELPWRLTKRIYKMPLDPIPV